MAYAYNRNTVEKFSIKGELSDDGTMITYINKDKEEKTIPVDRCFKIFGGSYIELTLAKKTTEDLEEEFEEE